MDAGIWQLRMRLIGFGLIWMAIWAIFGSLLAFRIQQEMVSGQDSWLLSIERELLRSAHSHMNAMGMLCALIGLALPLFERILSRLWIRRLTIILPLSIVFFGIGLLGEALYPPAPGSPPLAAAITGLGGSVFIFVLLILGVNALRRSLS